MSKKIIVIGGVAGGASCAARLRRLDETAKIIMFERGHYISFANCGLPYHIGGVIKERDRLLLQTPEAYHGLYNVDVRIDSEVTAIDRQKKVVTVRSGDKTYTESYDTLVLATGSSPLRPGIPGIDNEKVMQLWNIPDMDRIIQTINEKGAESAVVVGGGFIGVEMAENLVHAGLDVTLVDMMDQVMPPIDFDMAQILHKHMTINGVRLMLGAGVERFEDNENGGIRVVTSKETIQADIGILSIGVKPNSELASGCGLKLNKRGGIIVDEYLRTSDKNIYAVGDVVEAENFQTHEKAMVPLAGPANKMGRMAADNICGLNRKYNGTQGSSVAKVFDMTVAGTGLNEKQLAAGGRKLHRDYEITIIHPLSHAGYYPGGMPFTLKLIFDKDGKVLGGQAVGYKGVDKRIDVLADAIRLGATVYDLEESELCYAPPYSSAKDPVNMAGFSAANILSGIVDTITVAEMKELEKDTVVLDVRTEAEATIGEIEGSVFIPMDKLREKIDTLDKTKPYVVFCMVGIRAYMACRVLMQNGFNNVRNLVGGYTTYNIVSKDYTAVTPKGGKTMKKDKVMAMPLTAANTITIDACGLQCPGPVMKLHEAMAKANDGDVINIISSDPGFFSDAEAWSARTKNTFIKSEKLEDGFSVWIKKGCEEDECETPTAAGGNDKSLIVFSGDLDKALASFIIANGAAAMGRKVTMFFTFWGLNILRKAKKAKVRKTFIERMFGAMMPRGTMKLTLSKMNMMGMGSKMMRGIMKKKRVSSLDELIESALKNGVKIVACTMSMDVMGIKEEELIDGIELAGVASYLGAAESSDTNLFI